MRGDARAHKRRRGFTVVTSFRPTPAPVKAPRKRSRNAWLDARRAEYAAAIEAWECDAEAVTKGHAEELTEYARDYPRPTFKQILIDSRAQTAEEAEYADYVGAVS